MDLQAEPSARKDATAGLVFGRYQIIRRIAVGGMGEVFLARQSGVAGFDRLVILKSLLPDLAAQQDFVDQFLDEARVAATLNHPSLVSIFEVGQWNGTYFIAMEYIRGDNLSRLQRAAERQGKRVPSDVAASIIYHAAQALEHAHRATDLQGRPLQIVHRDISPHNIMVRTDGVTKVVDFGIAKSANRSSRTATGVLKGKVQYMAPEQVLGMELDGRADQFALGVVLWEMLAGRKLFEGKNEIEILRSVVQAPIPAIQSAAPEITAELARTVERMLAKERSDRYASLAEVASDLKRFLDVDGEKNAQEHTAAFVVELLGEEISSKTLDLTPSGAGNFVLQVGQSHSADTNPTSGANQIFPAKPAAVGVAAGATVAAALLGIAVVVVWFGQEVPQAFPSISADGPPSGQTAASAPTPIQNEGTKPAAPRYLLDSSPAGAEVRAGSVLLGVTPLDTSMLAPDIEHKLLVALQGHDDVSVTVMLSAGETYRDKVILPPLRKPTPVVPGREAPPAASVVSRPASTLPSPLTPQSSPMDERSVATGLFTLNTSPWAKVYVDGKYVDSTPIAKVELSSGAHIVRLVNEAVGIDSTRTITILAGEHLKQSWTLN